MRRFISALLVVCGLTAWVSALAQSPFQGFPPGAFQSRGALDPQPAGGGFTGIGDIQAYDFYGGLVAYNAATAGTKAINACLAADATCADLSTDATTGLLVVTTIGGSSCSVVTCTIKTLYDKVGTNDAAQATEANRPILTANALGTCWGMTFSNARSSRLLTGTGYTSTQPFSFAMIAKQPTAANEGLASVDNGSYGGWVLEFSAAGNINSYAGSNFNGAVTANTWYSLQFVVNGASSINGRNGTEATGDSGAQTPANYVIQLGNDATAQFNGVMFNFAYRSGTVSSGNRTSINTNQRALCGGF